MTTPANTNTKTDTDADADARERAEATRLMRLMHDIGMGPYISSESSDEPPHRTCNVARCVRVSVALMTGFALVGLAVVLVLFTAPSEPHEYSECLASDACMHRATVPLLCD